MGNRRALRVLICIVTKNHCTRISTATLDFDLPQAMREEFFCKKAELNVSIYVDGPVHKRFERLAKNKRTPVADLVNQLLKRDMELLESLS